jgi:hypothetical protein
MGLHRAERRLAQRQIEMFVEVGRLPRAAPQCDNRGEAGGANGIGGVPR